LIKFWKSDASDHGGPRTEILQHQPHLREKTLHFYMTDCSLARAMDGRK